MSDMANFFLEDVIEQENKRSLFHSGNMTDQDAYDNGFLGESGNITSFAGEYSNYSDVHSPESLDTLLTSTVAMLSGSSGFLSYVGHNFPAIKITESVHALSKDEEVDLFRKTLSEKYSEKFIKKVLSELEILAVHEIKDISKDDLTQLFNTMKNEYPSCYEGLNYILYTLTGSFLTGTTGVNEKAVAYAKARTNPTCNICENEMTERMGVYGKFYFCSNHCEGQKPVSDTYWQKFKNRLASM